MLYEERSFKSYRESVRSGGSFRTFVFNGSLRAMKITDSYVQTSFNIKLKKKASSASVHRAKGIMDLSIRDK